MQPLTLAVTTPNVLVAYPKFPADDVKSLIAYAKKNTGKLSGSIIDALKAPDVKERFPQQAFDVVANTPEQSAAFQRKEIERWREVVKQKNLTPE